MAAEKGTTQYNMSAWMNIANNRDTCRIHRTRHGDNKNGFNWPAVDVERALSPTTSNGNAQLGMAMATPWITTPRQGEKDTRRAPAIVSPCKQSRDTTTTQSSSFHHEEEEEAQGTTPEADIDHYWIEEDNMQSKMLPYFKQNERNKKVVDELYALLQKAKATARTSIQCREGRGGHAGTETAKPCGTAKANPWEEENSNSRGAEWQDITPGDTAAYVSRDDPYGHIHQQPTTWNAHNEPEEEEEITNLLWEAMHEHLPTPLVNANPWEVGMTISERGAANKDEGVTATNDPIESEETIHEDVAQHRQEAHARIGEINNTPALLQATPKTGMEKTRHSKIPYWRRRKSPPKRSNCNERLGSVEILKGKPPIRTWKPCTQETVATRTRDHSTMASARRPSCAHGDGVEMCNVDAPDERIGECYNPTGARN